ncbi:MAG: hypothetical protein LBV34_26845 [Nocardiopsaceae bacterium]|nr:hypothetical protein [Nocardiopsaceae bacterium]
MHDYKDFYLGSVTVAGALTGLLFVALSVAQAREEGKTSIEHQAVAGTAFTALLDSLWISLVALLPGSHGLPPANLVLGLLGVTSTAGLAVRLWRARSGEQFSRRWPVLLGLILATYVWQTVVSFTVTGSKTQELSTSAMFVLVFFAVGIARSWELLGMRGGGFLDLLVSERKPQREPADPPT